MESGINLRILVVEDDDNVRKAFVRFLSLAGHEVFAASCGRDAVALGAMRPHVGLIDLTLPDIDGLNVGRRLRQAMGDDVVLLAVTARNQMRDREASARAGFDAHIAKPVDMGALLARIHSAVLRLRTCPACETDVVTSLEQHLRSCPVVARQIVQQASAPTGRQRE